MNRSSLLDLPSQLPVKEAATVDPSYAMSGELYLANTGWIFLAVPNALVRAVFATMVEPGISLPTRDGALQAHISVMRPAEIEQLGGPGKLANDRGKRYRYSLGRMKTVEPHNDDQISRVWFLEVHRPELNALRNSYGLPTPKYPYHITVAVRRKNVLRATEVSKQ